MAPGTERVQGAYRVVKTLYRCGVITRLYIYASVSVAPFYNSTTYFSTSGQIRARFSPALHKKRSNIKSIFNVG